MGKNPYTKLGIHKGVYDKLDAADKSAYKKSVFAKYLTMRKNFTKEYQKPTQKYQPTGEDKRFMTGKGYHGLGPGELNRRIAQNEAIADVAFGKVSSKQKTLTAEDQAHVYRGLKFQGRADLFRKAKNYGKP